MRGVTTYPSCSLIHHHLPPHTTSPFDITVPPARAVRLRPRVALLFVGQTKERRSEVRYTAPSDARRRRGRGQGGDGHAGQHCDGQIERTYSAACLVRFFRSSWTTAGRERMLGCHFPTLPVALAF